MHHVSGVHRWEEDGVEYTCSHPPLTPEQQERKKWIDPASPAFKSLKDIVTDNNLLCDLKHMSLFKELVIFFLSELVFQCYTVSHFPL